MTETYRLKKMPAGFMAKFSRKWLVFSMCLVGSLSIVLRYAVPIFPIYGSMHDDELLALQGLRITEGQWLGEWNVLTLIKGPLYPILVSLSIRTGWSPILLAHLFLISSYIILIISLRRRLPRAGLAVLFTLLALNPILFGVSASRVYREVLAQALAVYLFAFVIMWIHHFNRRNRAKGATSIKLLILFGILVSYSLLNLTRYGNYWILVAILSLLVFSTGSKTSDRPAKRIFSQFAFVSLPLIFMLGGDKMFQDVVAQKNLEIYGIEIVDDYSGGEFPKLLSSMSSINSSQVKPFTFINSQQREIAYTVSPVLNSVKWALEGDVGRAWMVHSCGATGICDDLAGGWSPFAIRDAFAATYPTLDEASFQELLSLGNYEITAACEAERISCGSPGIAPGLPSVLELNFVDIAEKTGKNSLMALRSSDAIVLQPQLPAVGSNTDLWNILLSSKGSQNVELNRKASEFIKLLFAVVTPIFLLIKILGLFALIYSGLYKRKYFTISLLGFASLLGSIAQVGTISIMSSSAWGESVSIGYFMPGIPFLSVAAIAGLATLSKKNS